MTTSIVVGIAGHNRYLEHNEVQSWPAADGSDAMPAPNAATTLPALPCNPGDLILRNIGRDLTYTSSDGTVTLTFGSTLQDDGTFSGTASGTTYCGPYCSIAPGAIDLHDEAWIGSINKFARVLYTQDPNSKYYGVHVFDGENALVGSQLADYSVGLNHLHPGHPTSGHFVGGSAIHDSAAGGGLYFRSSGLHGLIEFHTNDGSGDADAGFGGIAGVYLLAATYQVSELRSDGISGNTYLTDPMIAAGASQAVNWPSNNPARAMISFCNYFPGSSSAATQGSGSLAAGNWSFRYCYYKSLTLKTGGAFPSTATVTIETPLSTPLDISSAPASSSYTFNVPATPAGWDGVRIYASNALSTAPGTFGSPYYQQSQTAGFSGGNVTVSIFSTAGAKASYGFAAWPSGTQLAKDPNARLYNLMKWAHVSSATDATTGDFMIHHYHVGTGEGAGVSQDAGSLRARHLSVATTYDATARPVLGQSGGELAWVAGGSGGSVTSVGLSLPGIFTVSGSPVTASGTLTATLASESANLVFAAPNGSAGTPTFRALVGADFGSQTASLVLASPNVFSGVPSFTTIDGSYFAVQNANTVLAGSTSGLPHAPSFRNLVAADFGSQTGNQVLASPNGSSGSPSFRTLAPADFATQTANTVLAAPNGFSGTSSFRYLVGADFNSQSQNIVLASPTSGTGNPTFRALVTGDMTAFGKGQTLVNNGTGANKSLTIVDSGDFGSWTGPSVSGSVSFGTTFPATPTVVVSFGGDAGSGAICYANGPTTTGFTINAAHAASSAFSHLYWVAVLPINSW